MAGNSLKVTYCIRKHVNQFTKSELFTRRTKKNNTKEKYRRHLVPHVRQSLRQHAKRILKIFSRRKHGV